MGSRNSLQEPAKKKTKVATPKPEREVPKTERSSRPSSWFALNKRAGSKKRRTEKPLHPEYKMTKRKMVLEAAAAIAADEEDSEGLDELTKELMAIETEQERAFAKAPDRNWWNAIGAAPRMYADVKLTDEERKRVSRARASMNTGLASSVPMTCPGRDICPFARGWQRSASPCEYANLQKEPIGRPCLVEVDLITSRTRQYAEEFQIGDSPEEVTDRLQCMELAEYDVYERRVTLSLSDKDRADLTEENVIGVDEHENPIFARQISLSWSLKVQIKNRRDKVLKQLVATREAKYKRDAALGQVSDDDHSTNFSGLMGVLNKIAADRKTEVTDAEIVEEER